MSRIDCSGTRTSSLSRCTSGFRKVWTVTSLGMSCAEGAARSGASIKSATKKKSPAEPCRYTSEIVYCAVPDGGPLMKRNVAIGTGLLALLVALGFSQSALQRTAEAQAKGGTQAPRFEVDPMWPKPLPNHWGYGNVIGVGVDTNDHIYLIHRT